MYLEQLILKLHKINHDIHVAVENKTFLQDKMCLLSSEQKIATASEIEKEVYHFVENCFDTLKDKTHPIDGCLTAIAKFLDIAAHCLDKYRPSSSTYRQVHISLSALKDTSWITSKFCQGVKRELSHDPDRKKVRALLKMFPEELEKILSESSVVEEADDVKKPSGFFGKAYSTLISLSSFMFFSEPEEEKFENDTRHFSDKVKEVSNSKRPSS